MFADLRNMGVMLHELAKDDPDAVCVEQDGHRFTRADVMSSAQALAAFYRQAGVGKGMSIAILAMDALRGIESLIALWSLEAATLFLDPRQTRDEVRTYSQRAGIDLIATDRASLAQKGGFVHIPSRDSLTGNYVDFQFPPGSEESDAVILSTSGTTGVPRFRRQTHRFFLNGLIAAARLMNTPDPKPSVIAGSLAFGAISGHWIRLMLTGRFILSLPLFHRLEDLDAAMSRTDIQAVGLPPVIIRDLLALHNQRSGAGCLPAYPHIERLSSVGGPIAKEDLVAAYTQLTPGVLNLYSMSGVGAVSILQGDDILRKPDSVGKPFDEIAVRIVDDGFQDLSVGQTGRIIVTPLWKSGSEPVDTGDIGWRDEDGFLYVTGRVHQMATRNSINVHLGELEQDVKRLDCVRDCLAFSQQSPGSPDDKIFLAVETLSDPHLVKEQIKSKLASYRRPDKILVQDRLPRNASNKIALGHLQACAEDQESGFVDF